MEAVTCALTRCTIESSKRFRLYCSLPLCDSASLLLLLLLLLLLYASEDGVGDDDITDDVDDDDM